MGSSLLAGLLVLAAAASAVPTTVGPAEAADATPPTYTNPLDLRATDGASIESCPDPAVIRGRGAEADRWFLYCTNASVPEHDRTPRTMLDLPTLVSSDLVSWAQADPAASQVPAPDWAAPGARLWAPDVVYSRTHRRYYLSFTVTDTAEEVSGEPGCEKDSAIGLVTSDSPMGPWRLAPGPLVAPRRTGPGCSFATTIDSDVLGDVVRRRGVLFYGGFHGGIEGQKVNVLRYRMAPVGEPRRLTTERYEAANVVKRGGWYYLVASSGLCCEGALSGYGAFVGRSSRPLGPYRDREGNGLRAQRTGGTPVLASNAQRWAGTGHTSLVRDRAGRWWAAYHGVDLADPAFAGRPASTKRPLLLDPVDWRGGWPIVRGGRGPSSEPVPGPAAKRGQASAYRPDWLADDQPGRVIPAATDDFAGSTLGSTWSWVREPAGSSYRVGAGRLELDTDAHDLTTARAPVLTTPAPSGDYVVETSVRLEVPGSSRGHVRAGLLVYGGEEEYVNLFVGTPGDIRTTELGVRVPEGRLGVPQSAAMSVGPPGTLTGLRLVHRSVAGHELFTAYTRQGGRRWIRGGTWRQDELGPEPRIGLAAFGAAGYVASFAYVRTWTVG